MKSKNSESTLSPSRICLCCGYSLTGLPVAHHCPECGLAYSPESIAIDVKQEQHPATLLISVVAWAAMGYVMFSSAIGKTWSLVFALIATTGVGLALLYGRFRRRLILDTGGIHVAVHYRIERSIRWDEIAGIELSRIDGGLLARMRNGHTISLCRDPKIAKACRKDLESALDDYLQRAACPKADSSDC